MKQIQEQKNCWNNPNHWRDEAQQKRQTKNCRIRPILLVKQKEEVEEKNKEVEEARKSLEEKAEQLQLTSKYKSEFLANMSHELQDAIEFSCSFWRSNYLKTAEGNLTEKQVRYAKTIHSCGDDLIQLINDILDLSKIESGYISTDFIKVRLNEITSFVETTFKHVSESKNLRFVLNWMKNCLTVLKQICSDLTRF